MGRPLDFIKAVQSKGDKSLKEKPYVNLKDMNDTYNLIEDHCSTVRKDYLKGWEKRGIWPLEILTRIYAKEKLLENIGYITDFRGLSKFNPPRKLTDLKSPKYAYFAGVAAGDGGFNGPNIWSIVDGGKTKELKYSRKFIKDISTLISDLFGILEKSISIIERKNRIVLKLSNKWFCRFIRRYFDLPLSYKKGELRKPSIFDSKTTTKFFWRGLFDTDGCISKNNYRLSLTSATKSFLKECKSDLKRMNIETTEIIKPKAYMLRIKPKSFETFANEIGFSHPRKKAMLLEKLRDGAKNYLFSGKQKDLIFDGKFYDLTQLKDLRIADAGYFLRQKREEMNFFQEELANKMDVTKNQIYYWENDIYSMPVNKLMNFFEEKGNFLEFLSEGKFKFKAGVRGDKSSFIHLPVRTDERVDKIAQNSIATKQEMRVKNKNEKIASLLERIFKVNVKRHENKIIVLNQAVIRFFKTFYLYKRKFPSYGNREIEKLDKEMSINNLI